MSVRMHHFYTHRETDQSQKPWQRYSCRATRFGPQGRGGHTEMR